jgi:tetratricopeptide (TPR) repeat protein
MNEDNNEVMEAALEAGRAVYHADLHYNLGVALFETFSGSMGENEGDLDSAIAEFREAVRLDSNNALAQYYLSLALSWRDLPVRPEAGELLPGSRPGTPTFNEVDKLVPVNSMPTWPAAKENIRKVYREQAGREPTEQELAVLKQRITGVPRSEGSITGGGLIEQRSIDFGPTEDFLQSLKTAGANEAFLNELGAAKLREPTKAKKPLNQVQVFALLAGQVPSHRVAMLLKERGIDFDVKDDYLQEVRLGGGGDELINALKSAKVTKPEIVDPAAEARQAEVRKHASRVAVFEQKGQYAQAEQEYRAALLLDPHSADFYDGLVYALGHQKKWDDAESAAREALRLHPNLAEAHSSLAWVLGCKGDRDGDIAECREAVRLNPKKDSLHHDLALALGSKGDWDGMMAEERVAVLLNPNNGEAHFFLGQMLEDKGDQRGALEEYRAAYMLDPKNATYKQNYERLLQQVNH